MTVTQIAPNTWQIDQGAVRSFLLAGTDAALVIDTGLEDANFLPAVRAKTTLPLVVVNTHYHSDHVGNNAAFSGAFAHRLDADQTATAGAPVAPVEEGHVFQLGARQVAVVHLGGHTPGSIALLDRTNRLLFVGDVIGTAPVWMNAPDISFADYLTAMDRLAALAPEVDHVFASHGEVVTSLARAGQMKAAAQVYLDGKLTPEDYTPPAWPDMQMKIVRHGDCAFLV